MNFTAKNVLGSVCVIAFLACSAALGVALSNDAHASNDAPEVYVSESGHKVKMEKLTPKSGVQVYMVTVDGQSFLVNRAGGIEPFNAAETSK